MYIVQYYILPTVGRMIPTKFLVCYTKKILFGCSVHCWFRNATATAYCLHKEQYDESFVSHRDAINFICRKEYTSVWLYFIRTSYNRTHSRSSKRKKNKKRKSNVKMSESVRVCCITLYTRFRPFFFAIFGIIDLYSVSCFQCFATPFLHSHFFTAMKCIRRTIKMNFDIAGWRRQRTNDWHLHPSLVLHRDDFFLWRP